MHVRCTQQNCQDVTAQPIFDSPWRGILFELCWTEAVILISSVLRGSAPLKEETKAAVTFTIFYSLHCNESTAALTITIFISFPVSGDLVRNVNK